MMEKIASPISTPVTTTRIAMTARMKPCRGAVSNNDNNNINSNKKKGDFYSLHLPYEVGAQGQCMHEFGGYRTSSPEGRPEMSDVYLLSGISGLSFESAFLSPLLIFFNFFLFFLVFLIFMFVIFLLMVLFFAFFGLFSSPENSNIFR